MLISNVVQSSSGDTVEALDIPNGFTGVLKLMMLSNLADQAGEAQIWVTQDGKPDSYLFDGYPVEANNTDVLLDSPSGIVLQPGQFLQFADASGGTMNLVVTIDLTYSPFDLGRYGSAGG